MRCEKAARMMSARLDGQLDDAKVARLEDHLATCSACRDEWRRMQALDHLLSSAPMMQAPVRLRAQVAMRISRREHARRAIIGGTALVLGAATLSLLLLAPVVIGLLDNLGIASALLIGGPETVAQLLTLVNALGRMLFALLDQFARPLAVLSLGSLLAALALNCLWISTMRRLRATH